MIFDDQTYYSANMQMLSEALRYAEALEAQLGDGSVGLAMSKQMFEFIWDNGGISATYDPAACFGRYRCSCFDAYPILDDRTMGPYIVPIVTAERFGGNIRYGTGTLIMRDGMIYQVTEVHPPYGFGLARTGLHISVDGSFILPDRETPNTYQQWSAIAGKTYVPRKTSSDEFEPTPELDQLLTNMTKQSE